MGAEAAWRQIVDLLGRGRIADPADEDDALARLEALRGLVPVAVRAASARALAFAKPPAALVCCLALDEIAVAAPILRTSTLEGEAWPALIGRLSPAGRAVLRQRRDLPDEAARALESYGAADFALADERPVAVPIIALPGQAEPAMVTTPEIFEPMVPVPAEPPLSPTPFVSLADVARGLPVVAEALRQVENPRPAAATPLASPRFEIADLVARIDAFQRDREDTPPAADDASPGNSFRFETDAAGVIRWVEGVSRAALVGVSIAHAAMHGIVRVDAGAAAAFRRRTRFIDLRLEVAGLSDAAGSWRIAGTPLFDRESGRFTGFRGSGRRPWRHETAAPASHASASEGLRQLVHELRTPANAVAGFAELIETELLGPVAEAYRRRAGAIRSQASGLLTAIDDLDTAARIEGHALDLRPGTIAIGELAARLATDLAPLARQRGASVTLSGEEVVATVDDRAAERLMARLLSTLVSAAAVGERIAISVRPAGDQAVVAFTRPRALADLAGDALFSLDDRIDIDNDGPLLGAGFTLRLVRNLASELGGALAIEADRLTLRLPASERHESDAASTS